MVMNGPLLLHVLLQQFMHRNYAVICCFPVKFQYIPLSHISYFLSMFLVLYSRKILYKINAFPFFSPNNWGKKNLICIFVCTCIPVLVQGTVYSIFVKELVNMLLRCMHFNLN